MRSLLLSMALIFGIGVGRAEDTPAFSPKDSSFRISFPAAPHEMIDEMKSTSKWVAKLESDAVLFVVQKTVAGVNVLDAKVIAEAYAKNVEGAKVAAFQFGDTTAYEVTFTLLNIETQQRIYVLNNTLWQVAVISSEGKARTEDRKKFFDSLEIPTKVK